MGTFHKAELETRNFFFEAYGGSTSDAMNAMRALLETHCTQYPGADASELFEDATVKPVELGAGYRGGELVTQATYTRAESLMGRTLDQLTVDAESFCKSQGIPHDDMAEIALRDDLSESQREWIRAYQDAWEARV